MSAPMVTVRGEAELEVPPDLAELRITLHGSGAEAKSVYAELSRSGAGLTEVLDRYAAAIEERATVGAHVGPVFHRRSQTKITGYRGSQHTRVVVHDFEALSPLLLAVAELPNGQADGPTWSLRRDNPVFREARLAAIDDARSRAADYAAGFGGRIAELLEISDLEEGFGGARPMAMYARGGGPVSDEIELDLEPQPQRVSGRITVRFGLAAVSVG
ncbi:SIMPL domain-containing protein [Microlunatus sp. GCM10028923]|uniref:SIMPL domain-containing protein n=1 Tax=Microlunatus sp. GCM10028923 TaxID=3273400 RepID=UPI003618CD0D